MNKQDDGRPAAKPTAGPGNPGPPVDSEDNEALSPTRRQFMLAAAAATLGASTLMLGAKARAASSTLEAYAAATSVLQGGTLAFHARDPGGSDTQDRVMDISIVRLGFPDVQVLAAQAPVRNRPVPADAYSAGCGWPVSYLLQVGAAWPSGLYLARFGPVGFQTEVPFVVRPSQPGSAGAVLVQVQFTTLQAYNAWGGKSLYEYNSSNGERACQVSFNRPLEHTVYEGADPWVPHLVRWLAKNGIAAEFCTSLDLHRDAALLTPYQLFITAGHDEYWSRAMRQRLDAFVWAGGNAISLSGNTCWWQIRMQPDSAGTPDRSMVCYKSLQSDPDADPTLKTVNWIDLSPAWPENATLGLGFTQGAIWANGLPRPATPYVVMQPEHWAFAGTGLGAYANFGGDIVGYETDAVDVAWGPDGRLYPTGADGAPRNLKVLAVADATGWAAQAASLGSEAQSGLSVIGVYTQGGTVFAAGSTDWVHGLIPELQGQTATPVSRITLNAIQKLVQRNDGSLPVEVLRYHVVQAGGDGVRFFFTTSGFVDASWTLDGVVFHAAGPQDPEAVPVYQYHADQADGDGQRQFYALSNEVSEGWTLDGVAFHAYAEPAAGRVPIYRYHAVQANGDGWRFLYSTDPNEGNGWTIDEPVFYTPA